MEENGANRQSAPTSVRPMIETLDSSLVFRPKLTFSPMTQLGPIQTPESNRAFG